MAEQVSLQVESDGDDEGKNASTNLSEEETSFVEGVQPILSLREKLKENGRAPDTNSCDKDGWTPLHYAAYNNHLSDIKALLLNGADPEVQTKWGRNFDKIWIGQGSTALHLAAEKGHEMAALYLLEPNNHVQQCGPENSSHLKPANVDSETSRQQTPLHLACRNGHLKTVTVLLEHGADANEMDKYGRTPLHHASKAGHLGIVEILLKKGAQGSINQADGLGETPIHIAGEKGDVKITTVLLKEGAEIHRKGSAGRTVVHCACRMGNTEVLKMFLAHETAIFENVLKDVDVSGNTPLMLAILGGHEDIVKAILKKFDPATTRKFLMIRNKRNTTPIQEAIRKIPDVAAMMLDLCTEPDTEHPNNSKDYKVTLYYSILEGFPDSRDVSSSQQSHQGRKSSFQKCEGEEYTDDAGFMSEWFPRKFDHKRHPLNLIAQSKNLKLMKHPLVTNCLKRKWRMARAVYFIGLVVYCIFLAFLTAFALTVPSPLSRSCQAVNRTPENASFVESDGCELSDNRKDFVFTAAILVIIFALFRLITEAFQMYAHGILYFADWVNWMELLMTVFAIIFAWVFSTNCMCTYRWQWKMGTIAVLLAWFDLIIFVQKLPDVGIYVGMLRHILWSFIKTTPLAIMLIIAFGLGFFMLFSDPMILRSPFSTPAQSLLTMIAYSTGEFDYNGLFRLRLGLSEEGSDVEEIPFPSVSYIVFIIFVIIMPILLSNLLTALAVGDTGKILQNAESWNIALKIHLILSVEDILPANLQRTFVIHEELIYPNRELTMIKMLLKKLHLRAILPKGIEISEVLKRDDNSHKETLTLMKDVQEIKNCLENMNQTMENTLKQDNLLPNSILPLTLEIQEIKQSQEELKQMMHKLMQKLA